MCETTKRINIAPKVSYSLFGNTYHKRGASYSNQSIDLLGKLID